MSITTSQARELESIAELALKPEMLEELLNRALDSLRATIPYDLATVFELGEDDLTIRAMRGPLAIPKVKEHHLKLSQFPTMLRALEGRKPIALLEEDHAGEEGDPFDGVLDLPHGHSCMVVPLVAGEHRLGVMTFDRRECTPYEDSTVSLAGVYGQIVSLAFHSARQAEELNRLRMQLAEQNRLLIEDAGGGSDACQALQASQTPAMRRLVSQAQAVARTDTPVLIRGETGAGKEVLAHAIHAWSARADRPLVTVNCGAIPEALIESELFGHVEGAFSGAVRDRPGRFATADGGTLFLDEIGELPLPAQAKLLRVLQQGTFEPVGSDATRKVEVRILAATHVDLELAVKDKRFREDLFYRLDVFPLILPPLRDRTQDIPRIAADVLRRLPHRFPQGAWYVTQAGEEWLKLQPWPGNIRHLKNVLERATILASSREIDVDVLRASLASDHSAPQLSSPRDASPALPAGAQSGTLEELERAYIQQVLRSTSGKVYGKGGAAEILGLKPSTLQSRMKKLGIERLPD